MTEQAEQNIKRWHLFSDGARYYVERAWAAQEFGHTVRAVGSYEAMQAAKRLLSGEVGS